MPAIYRRIFFGLGGLAVLVAAVLLWRVSWSCTPSFLGLSTDEIVAEYGHARFGIRVALVGCSNELSAIRPEEIAEIRSVLASSLRDHGWRFLDGQSLELRRLLVSRVNNSVGRRLVTDIFVYSFSSEE